MRVSAQLVAKRNSNHAMLPIFNGSFSIKGNNYPEASRPPPIQIDICLNLALICHPNATMNLQGIFWILEPGNLNPHFVFTIPLGGAQHDSLPDEMTGI